MKKLLLTFAAIALILAGVQILCLGLASEIVSRTYYESQKKSIYVTKTLKRPDVHLEFGPKSVVDSEEDRFPNAEIDREESTSLVPK